MAEQPDRHTVEGGFVRKRPTVFVVLLLTSAALITAPSVTATPRQERLSTDKAISLMRLILSLENPTTDRKTYLNLADLLQASGSLTAAERQHDGLPDIHLIDPSSGEALDYVVRVTTSDDKTHFQASLEPRDPICAPAFFGDDRGVIYVGKGLGCPAR